MENQNYGDVFCQAVDTIVTKRLEGVSYDSTILCTIVDDSRKEEGVYVVSNNNQTKFEAYSTNTSYRTNDNVYVQIPGGDWNQQKIILSKKKDKSEEPFIYKSPLDSFVDITGNLIGNSLNSGLVANGTVNEQPIWEWQVGNQNPPLTAYSRLGISGSFKSWLNPFYDDDGNATEVKYGNYGYRLIITTEAEKNIASEEANDVTEAEKNITHDAAEVNAQQTTYELTLDCSDMIGNPYNFQSYYHQEKVFDISQIGKIVKMKLYFFQEGGSFKDDNNKKLPHEDFLGNLVTPNLFTTEPVISLGYDISEFNEELVSIYTLDSITYSRTASPTHNTKSIDLRWIHKQEDGTFTSIDRNENNLNYEVIWYRYELGHASADNYSGVYWKNYAKQENDNDFYLWNDGEKKWELSNDVSFFNIKTTLNCNLQEEKFKAIIIYDNKPYRSNILTFVNEDEVVNNATIDAIQALSIVCSDNTYGNYYLYGQNHSLLDMSQRNKEREFVAYFKSAVPGVDTAPTELTEAESIEWIIPTKNTMIEIDTNSGTIDNNDYLHITSNTQFSQSYRIKSYYSQSYNNNTIQCKIVKAGITYTATKELTFGTAGTTGTDFTFVLDFDNGATALTVGSDNAVTVTARLYDYDNKEVNISDKTITWGWKTTDELIKFPSINSATGASANTTITQEIQLSNGITTVSASYNILQASITWGDWDLIAYLPIPIRSNEKYEYISGTTQVIYNSSGEISDCPRNPYILYKFDSEQDTIVKDTSITWQCINKVEGEKAYTPTLREIDGAQYLSPLSFYVEDTCKEVCVVAKTGDDETIVWSQPILIMQNRYPSAMINEWDGSLDVGEKDPGTILAPRLVAGKKNSNNTFSGVVLGDWTPTNSSSELTAGTGLFGYYAGEQSYGFRDDGTAFIGKSGAGRLLFDGSESTITSNRYAQNHGGMELDFDDGSITLIAPDSAAGIYQNKTISIDAAAEVTPFKIGEYFKVEWDGTLTATNGNFTGDIQSGSTITGATIKGGTLGIGGDNHSNFVVGEDGSLKIGTNVFTVSSTGAVAASNINITGGQLTIGSGFRVTTEGILTAEGAKIKGTITAGKGSQIGGWTITDTAITNDKGITLDTTNGLTIPSINIIESDTVAGVLGYVTPSFTSDDSSINNAAGIGITVDNSQNKQNLFKVTQEHIGATDGKAYWYIRKGNIKLSGDEVNINNLKVSGTCNGVYATLG